MNPNTKDQEWQQLQSRINNLVGYFSKNDFLDLEHKTHLAALLQPPPEYHEQKVEEPALTCLLLLLVSHLSNLVRMTSFWNGSPGQTKSLQSKKVLSTDDF